MCIHSCSWFDLEGMVLAGASMDQDQVLGNVTAQPEISRMHDKDLITKHRGGDEAILERADGIHGCRTRWRELNCSSYNVNRKMFYNLRR
jgi:hypothetical protein